jgi:DNA-binding transcriptional MerR regulator
LSRNKYKQFSDKNLPAIPPDKRYFTISEVVQLCLVKAYVLRYWEKEFEQLKPIKRRHRRYYQQQDILLIRKIKKLLYEHGFTIEGARGQLASPPEIVSEPIETNIMVKKIITDLEMVVTQLKTELYSF